MTALAWPESAQATQVAPAPDGASRPRKPRLGPLLAAEALAHLADRAVPLALGRRLPVRAYAAVGVLLPLLAGVDLGVRAPLAEVVTPGGAGRPHGGRLQGAVVAAATLGLLGLARGIAGAFGGLVPVSAVRLCAGFAVAVGAAPRYAGRLEAVGARPALAVMSLVGTLCRLLLLGAFLAQGLGLGGLVGAYALGAAAAVAFAAWSAPAAPRAVAPARTAARVVPVLAAAVTRGALALLRQLDVLVLARVTQHAAWTATYAAASALVKPPAVFPAGATRVGVDVLGALAGPDRDRAREALSSMVQATLVSLVPAAALGARLAPDLLAALFAEAYPGATTALVVLALGLPGFALHELLTHALVAFGHGVAAAVLTCALVPLELLLLTQWFARGFPGGAAAAVVTAALGAALAGLWLAHAGRLALPRWAVLARLAAVGAACAALPAPALLEGAPVAGGALAYVGALALLAAAGDLDVRRLRALWRTAGEALGAGRGARP